MSKHLFNFCVCHDYVEQLEQTGKNLPEYVNSLGLDGIEHLVYTKEPPSPTFRESSTGAHLAYWPYWLGFWKNNKARLKREFKSAKARNDCYLGAMNKDEWLSVIQQNLIAAEAVKPMRSTNRSALPRRSSSRKMRSSVCRKANCGIPRSWI